MILTLADVQNILPVTMETTKGAEKPRTVVLSAEPQQQPQREDLGPGDLQLVDEEAEQEGPGGEREAVQRLTAGREEQHPGVILAAQEAAGEGQVIQLLQKLP